MLWNQLTHEPVFVQVYIYYIPKEGYVGYNTLDEIKENVMVNWKIKSHHQVQI